MKLDLKHISALVNQQFPSFYQEDGPNFIQFVQAYYEWLDTQGSILKSRELLEFEDIDEVSDEYLNYFMTKFMRGIPKNIVSDRRLLEKHILDVYRSKGSIEGLKLIFRLLYNLESNVYLPATDILKTSDGKWVRRQYFEVEERPLNFSYSKKRVTGSSSGATAYVTDSIVVNTTGQLTHVMYIDDVQLGPSGSSFVIGEYLVYDGLDIRDATLIKGSPVAGYNIVSTENNTPGDRLYTSNTIGENLIFDVSNVLDKSKAKGYINFVLVNGGYGYTLNSIVNVTYKTASTGTGAFFKIKKIANTTTFKINTNNISNLTEISLNNPISSGGFGPHLRYADINSILDNALTDETIQIGTIAELTGVTSGDHNYNGSVSPTVVEPQILGYGIQDKNGSYWGNNAIITGDLASGNGVISNVELISSGFGFNKDNSSIEFYNETDNALTSVITIQTGAIGLEEGYWADNSGFLNSDKYIEDNDYYQQFSYEVQLEKSLNKYIDVLKQIYHPIGNRVFGKPIIIDANKINEQILVETVTVYR